MDESGEVNMRDFYKSFPSLLLGMFMALRANTAGAASPSIMELTTGWQLARVPDVTQNGNQISQASFNASSWISAVVPGTALYSYQAAGLIPDPYYGTNMAPYVQSGCFDTYYWYRTAFVAPPSYAGQKIWLNFDGINWKADVYVNGNYLGQIDGPFTRAKFDVSSVITPGATNVVAVEIYWSNATVYDSPTFVGAGGWDFMPVIAGRDVGIYQDVYVSTSGSVNIVDPFISSTLPLPATSPASLTLQVALTNNSSTAQSGTLLGSISPDGITFQTNVTISAGALSTFTLSPGNTPALSVTNPALWWPNGYGPQNLHTLQLAFQSGGSTSDVQTVTFGIRQYSYNTNGHDLQLQCNGQPILCKGGCWGMPDAMLKYTPAQLDTAVHLHQQMNMTMIRCWHGTSDLQAFYDACDRYGIMVWDEFWLNGSNFGLGPTDPGMFIANSVDKYKRLRNHAAMAVWCGENEAVPPGSLELPQDYATYDGTRIYIDASNAGPIHGGMSYMVEDPAWYFQAAYGFTTEIGMPCVPPVESVQAMMPANGWWPPGDTNWQQHGWAVDIGNKGLPQYTNAVSSRYGAVNDITNFCKEAQYLNLESFKALFEAWNSKMWAAPSTNPCSGALLWMSQQALPALIWQTYDWSFELGGAFFGCKKACEPLHIQWDINDNSIRVIDATPQALNDASAGIQVYNLNGTMVDDVSLTNLNLPANSMSNCFTLFSDITNYALHKLAYASSIDNSSDAITNAVDGNLSTRWSSAYSDPQWFYVDLGATQTISTIVIPWETAYPTAFQIRVSNDATNWTTVWSTNGMTLTSSGGTSISAFAATKARYVEMYGTQRATGWGYSMYEFDVYGPGYSMLNNLSSVYFLKLRLQDSAGNLLSDNFYWCGTTYLNYAALSALPSVKPVCSTSCSLSNGWATVTCLLTNASTNILFGARLKLVNETTGLRVLPVIYSDNYFALVPGESKTVTLLFTNDFQATGPLQLMLEGWNTPSQSLATITLEPAVPVVGAPAVSPTGPLSIGSTVTLSCANWSGPAPVSFQWQFSSGGAQYQNISGATTNSLVLPNAGTNNTGFYQLILTANGQTATSSVAPLAIATGLIATPRISVKFAADMGYAYDVVGAQTSAGALNSTNWINLYGPDGASNGVSAVPYYTRNGLSQPSSSVMVYSYAGEGNSDNEQAALPSNLALMDSFIWLNNNCWYLSVTNLDPAFTNGYSVYLYIGRPAPGLGGHYFLRYHSGRTTNTPALGTIQWNFYTTTTNNDGHFTRDMTPANAGTSDETYGANYIVFTNLSGGAFDLLLTNGNGGCVNGLEIVANPAATSSSLGLSGNPVAYGLPVTLTNLVSPAPLNGETVAFMDGTTLLGMGTLAGGMGTFTTRTLAGGTHALSAVYGGDGTFLASTSGVVNLMVTGGLTLSPPVALPSSNVYVGATVTLVCSNFTGTPPYDFQWQSSANGLTYTNLPGATTNALTMANLTAGNAGFYQLAYGASAQWITSSVVQLVVNPPPVISVTQPSGGNVVLSWPGGGMLLQSTNASGPWLTNSASSPFTNQPDNPQMFFRVRVQ